MSKIKFIAVTFLLFSSLLFSSCEDEPIDPAFTSDGQNNGGGGQIASYYVKATTDGVSKQWNTTQAVYIKLADGLILSGSDGSTSMSLSLGAGIEPQAYSFNLDGVSCGYTEGLTIYSSNYSNFEVSAGNITVTELNKTNKTIKGTFTFTGKNNVMTLSKVFTKGEFFVKYIEQ